MATPLYYDGTLKIEDDAVTELPLAFVEKRFTETIEDHQIDAQTLHVKERTKTMSVALTMCLNIGVTPPEVYKPTPCARLECWIDPFLTPAQKALETIGQNLVSQYRRWHPRARYKTCLDPTVGEVQKTCISLRKNAKEDRVLFHYNGHGVPQPTANGEIWVFNEEFTQYIPLSIYDLQSWMGTPSIYVFDCSYAGVIVENFHRFAQIHDEELEQEDVLEDSNSSRSIASFKDCILLASCGSNQVLPSKPDLPADIFTSSLTTPVKMAIHWHMLQNPIKFAPNITLEMIDKIPGLPNDRRTMLGELHWIFTAITDTIAWTTLPRELFLKLFRQDLLLASLFRNFLLADRIMRSYDRAPISHPELPSTCHHPMWDVWDYTLEVCLAQLPAILSGQMTYTSSQFFEEQITAFEIWLRKTSDERHPPEQLSIVLQVLLRQTHRLRALVLLSDFVDIGLWAVNQAVTVNIYPYVLKLLQSNDPPLRKYLLNIWSKILAVEHSCQVDLVREEGYLYFLQALQDVTLESEFRAMAAFAMSVIVKDYLPGREVALQKNLVAICLEQMNNCDAEFRLWIIICLANLWDRYDVAKWCGVRDLALEKLYVYLWDSEPEVRAAAVYALGTFLNSDSQRTEHAINVEQSVTSMLMNNAAHDMSTLVRKELINALQWVIMTHENSFLSVTVREMRMNLSSRSSETVSYGSFYTKVWHCLSSLEDDPYPAVASMAQTLLNYLRDKVSDSVSKELSDRMKKVLFNSLPSSPSSRSYLMNDSPSRSAGSSVESDNFGPQLPQGSPSTNSVSSLISEKTPTYPHKQLVSTKFISWCSSRYLQPKRRQTEFCDPVSESYHERLRRNKRNQTRLQKAREECRRAHLFKIKNEVFSTKGANPPGAIVFHPYESYFVISARDAVTIWDYNSNSKLSHWRADCNLRNRETTADITALEFINAQNDTMLLAGSKDGCVRVWSNYNHDPTLVTAWQALPEASSTSSNRNSPLSNCSSSVGLCLAWDQKTRSLFTGGDARLIRIWDVQSELASSKVTTGADSSVNCLSVDHDGGGNIFSAGFNDGSIRIFDRRLPSTSNKTMTYREHDAPIIAAKIRHDPNMLVAGCQDGVIKVYDIRMKLSSMSCKTAHSIGAFDVHREADIFACGSVNQLTTYDLKGNILDSLQSNDWFVLQKIPSTISHIAFHPHRIMLGYSFMDSSVIVSSLLPKRRISSIS